MDKSVGALCQVGKDKEIKSEQNIKDRKIERNVIFRFKRQALSLLS